MKNYSGCLQMGSSSGLRKRTTVVNFICRTTAMNGFWTENNSGWHQMENGSGLRKENDSGELQMEKNSNGL